MHLIPPPRGDTHLTFIGGGTMACAVLDGLVSSGLTTFVPNRKPKYSFSITARRQDHALELSERYPGAYITIDNSDENLWQFPDDDQPSAHLVLICTKPDSTHEVCQRIVLAHDAAPAHRALPTVITMCPGIKVSTLESWLDRGDGQSRFPVIRTMPNTPVSLRQGTTALIASPRATADQVDRVVELFRVFSPCVEILPDEELLNVAAAVSGSGPAYIFQFYESLVAGGVRNGLPETLARSLVMQTGVGASVLARDRPDVPLRDMIGNVCVPGGSTEKGVKSLEGAGLKEAVIMAIDASLKANKGMANSKDISLEDMGGAEVSSKL